MSQEVSKMPMIIKEKEISKAGLRNLRKVARTVVKKGLYIPKTKKSNLSRTQKKATTEDSIPIQKTIPKSIALRNGKNVPSKTVPSNINKPKITMKITKDKDKMEIMLARSCNSFLCSGEDTMFVRPCEVQGCLGTVCNSCDKMTPYHEKYCVACHSFLCHFHRNIVVPHGILVRNCSKCNGNICSHHDKNEISMVSHELICTGSVVESFSSAGFQGVSFWDEL